MVAVHQHLGLDDRDEAGLLRQRRVPRERVRVRPHAVLARDAVADRDHAAPLGEARSELAVLLEPRAQAVESLCHRLAFGEREGLRAFVDFDPGYDAFRLEQLRERRPVGRRLADRLVEQDYAADELLDALRREQQLAIVAPALFRGLDADRVETLLDRSVALVRGEDPFALGDERAGCFLQVSHRSPPGVQYPAAAPPPAPLPASTRARLARWRSTTPDGSPASRVPCPRPSGRRR